MVKGLVRGGDGELDEAVHLSDLPLGNPFLRIESAHLGCNLGCKSLCIEPRNGTDTALAVHKRLPKAVNGQAQRAYTAHTSNHYPSMIGQDTTSLA